ncbi:hypothetical protein IE53DRAFT_365920 [Violaceomyces palustris]|uniref:Uncharacterized protein n=1 Tax=Violaceomyces palustris TaxID=1673888 RepID=A0ACD0P7L6_9BASI|nr:hypothetical protein IE53DRAFT_365920 [Violaceomyces palustris]
MASTGLSSFHLESRRPHGDLKRRTSAPGSVNIKLVEPGSKKILAWCKNSQDSLNCAPGDPDPASPTCKTVQTEDSLFTSYDFCDLCRSSNVDRCDSDGSSAICCWEDHPIGRLPDCNVGSNDAPEHRQILIMAPKSDKAFAICQVVQPEPSGGYKWDKALIAACEPDVPNRTCISQFSAPEMDVIKHVATLTGTICCPVDRMVGRCCTNSGCDELPGR